MRHTLSSKWTLPNKIFNIIVAVFPLIGLAAAYRELAHDPLYEKCFVVAAVSAWSLFFLWINYRLKFASVDENNLYVSRLFREKTIPLSDIADIRLTTIGFIWVGVYFHSNTPFGKKIFFMPEIVGAFVWSLQRRHPVVDELRSLAKVIE